MIEKVKPAWLAWDSLFARGECIRCGTVIDARDGERPDAALARHIDAHEGCTEETGRELARERERSKIRATLERARLIVDPSAGIALRDPIDPGVLSSLVTDDRLRRSDDPAVQTALGKALVALGELHREVKRKGWTPKTVGAGVKGRLGDSPTPVPPGYPSIVSSTHHPGALHLVIDAGQDFANDTAVNVQVNGRRIVLSAQSHDALLRAAGPNDYADGYRQAYDALADRQIDREIERRKAEVDLQFKTAALEKMLRTLNPAMLLGQKPKPETYIVPISAGSCQCSTYPWNNGVCVAFSLDRHYEGSARVVDIKLPESVIVSEFRFADEVFCYDVTSETLMKHCAAICREKPVRLFCGMPLVLQLRAVDSNHPPVGGFEELLRLHPIEIMMEVEKPIRDYGAALTPRFHDEDDE